MFRFLLLFLLIVSSFLSFSEFKMMQEQNVLLKEFNTNIFQHTFSEVSTFVEYIPNIGVTTIPIKTFKANYLYREGNYHEAIELAKSSKKYNPYLYLEDLIISQSFFKLNNVDSSLFYIKKAVVNLPKVSAYSSHYFMLLDYSKRFTEMDSAFNVLSSNHNLIDWTNYFRVKIFKDNSNLSNLEKYIDSSIVLFPEEKSFLSYRKILDFGLDKVNLANQLDEEANNLYKKRYFVKAAEKWIKASMIITDDFSYLQNAAVSYVNGLNFEKALDILLKLPEDYKKAKSGEIEFILSKIYISNKDTKNACYWLDKSVLRGFKSSIALKEKLCN